MDEKSKIQHHGKNGKDENMNQYVKERIQMDEKSKNIRAI